MSEDQPKKKLKVAEQRFKTTYSQKWPCLRPADNAPHDAYCVICNATFSVKHGGLFDCSRHISSKKHVTISKLKAKTKPIASFVENESVMRTTKAEMHFTSFLIEHNVALSAADHAGALFREMFEDSNTVKNYACARTKTTAIVKCMATKTAGDIISKLKEMPFSMATDGSTDLNSVKLYPIVVRYFDAAKGKIMCSLLCLKESSDNTGEGIFKLIDCEMDKHKIQWKKCVAFSCDNANVMVGGTKGVAAYLKKVNPSIITQGCLCHLLHICAQKASKELECDIDTLLIDIYYFLEKSSKRKKLFIDCQELFGLEPLKFLKFSSTRWLSLLDSVKCLVLQWDAIVELFCSSGDKMQETEKSKSIKEKILSPDTKLYLLFLEATLPVFTSLNLKLQSEAPLIHFARRYLNSFLTDLLVRFVKPSSIADFPSDIAKIKYHKTSHQKADEDLVIGTKTRAYLLSGTINEDKKKSFYQSVRKFYEAACTYAIKKLPLDSEFFRHAEVVDPVLRAGASYSSVMFFVDLFKDLVDSENLDALEMEFSRFQADPLTAEILETTSADQMWSKISNLRDLNQSAKYNFLPKVMLAVLLVPQSNAASERVFSIVRHNLTEFRSTMSIETLNSLLIEKIHMLNSGEHCYNRSFSKDEILKAKSCTSQLLKQGKKS